MNLVGIAKESWASWRQPGHGGCYMSEVLSLSLSGTNLDEPSGFMLQDADDGLECFDLQKQAL